VARGDGIPCFSLRNQRDRGGTAFFDSNGIDHSTTEARRFRLAQSAVGNILVIAYTLRSHGLEKIIRVISARLANRKEKKRYQEERN